MRKWFIRLFLFLTVLLVFTISSHLCLASTAFFVNGIQDVKKEILDEEIRIRKAVEELYIKGLEIRDFELIKKVCIPEAKLMSVGRGSKLGVTTLEKWSKRFDPKNPPFKKLDWCLVKIDREGTAAQVKILFIVDSSRHVTDFLHMLKIDGKWRIVNIIDY